MNLYNQAQADGALSNPVANQIVTQLVSQIIAMGDHFENTTNRMNTGFALNYLPSLASIDSNSHVNSYGICITGSNTDSGIQCQ